MGDMHAPNECTPPERDHPVAPARPTDQGRGAAPGSLAAALAGLPRPQPTPHTHAPSSERAG